MNKKASLIIGIIVILIAVIVVASGQSSKNTTTPPTPVVTDTSNPTSVPNETTKPTPTPTASGYTLATVAKHNTAADCWTTVNGSVYNVTSWIKQHPGGSQAIIGLCGIDGSAAFNGQHGGQKRPESELASFKIGALTK